ncbi:bystin isoform X2 [Amaranthus tricolor]|uniref:bystin isoform X2 n=1 Tax=Amaranthus tricolor TaxID=29722 RepID=UPI00258A3CB4|nr:bystin isoform X2 [Amaranthus tricolor]
MGNKRRRERNVNPQPFLATEESMAVSRNRSRPPKRHQEHEQMILNKLSDKILKEAFKQQKEIVDEQNDELNVDGIRFYAVQVSASRDNSENIDDFAGFSETRSQFDDYEDQINEEDEKLLEAFLSKDVGPQPTLGDVIAARIKEQDINMSSARPTPKLDSSVIEHYKAMGKLLSTYTSGKLPKGFKHIPAMSCWEEVLYLTEPEKWSPAAVYQATRIFASNMNSKRAERFYKLVLLPRVREDIRKHKRLHFELFQTLKKALYKPAAFNKGILFPLFKSGNCNLREAVIVGSVVQKMSIPRDHSSVALLRLAEMDYCGTTSYIIKLFIDKKHALPHRVLDALVTHFMRFLDDSRVMPVIWHQTLLAFVQRYRHDLRKEDKDNLNQLMQKQRHYLVTPEILRELNLSRNRGEKDHDNMLMSSVSVINKTVEEDRFDIPEVPMEEDD